MNLSRVLKKEPFPSGVYVIRGEQGVGKTSFAAALLSMDYKRNFDRYHEKLNAEHVTLALSSRSEELMDFVAETLEKDERTMEFIMEDALCIVKQLLS